MILSVFLSVLLLVAGLESALCSHLSETVGKVTLRLPLVKVPALSVPYRTKIVNLMLPPADKVDLCPPPSSRSLQEPGRHRPTSSYSSNNDPPSSIALLVSQNERPEEQCSFTDKARVAEYYQRTLEPNLEFIIARGIDDPTAEQGVRLPEAALWHMSTAERLALFGDITYIIVNSTHWNVLSEQLYGHADETGVSPFLSDTTDHESWILRLQIAPYDDGTDALGIFWGSLLVMIVIVFCCTLIFWCHRRHYSTMLRRQNAIVPEGGGDPAEEKRLLTREQVLALPEVIYPTNIVFADPSLAMNNDKPLRLMERLGDSKGGAPTIFDSMINHAGQESSRDDQGSERSVPTTEHSGSSMDVDEEDSSRNMCSICIHEYQEGERLRMLPACRHVYHTECIVPWLTKRQSCCPYCKTEVLYLEDNDDEGSSRIEEDSFDGEPRLNDDLPL